MEEMKKNEIIKMILSITSEEIRIERERIKYLQNLKNLAEVEFPEPEKRYRKARCEFRAESDRLHFCTPVYRETIEYKEAKARDRMRRRIVELLEQLEASWESVDIRDVWLRRAEIPKRIFKHLYPIEYKLGHEVDGGDFSPTSFLEFLEKVKKE